MAKTRPNMISNGKSLLVERYVVLIVVILKLSHCNWDERHNFANSI